MASRFATPVVAGLVLFALNNFLLARVLTALPGGTILAPTDTAVVALVALRVRRFGSVALLFATYSALGVLGHLGVDAGSYLLHLPIVLVAALVWDGVLAAGRYRLGALAVGLVPFAAITRAGLVARDWRSWAAAVGLAALGLAAGALAHEALRRRVSRA